MAISPPSDILLDVARAADPTKVQAATARLARLAADPAATNEGFSKAMAAARSEAKAQTASTNVSVAALATGTPAARALPAQVGTKPKTDVYQKFEAVLLQSFVESMLPKDEELFGDKNSAGVYRSMMAEQFATQISKAGGIGIAKAVAHAHPAFPKPIV
jgi:flagellar protein FlgJ